MATKNSARPLKKSKSTKGIFGLFSKPNVERSDAVQDVPPTLSRPPSRHVPAVHALPKSYPEPPPPTPMLRTFRSQQHIDRGTDSRPGTANLKQSKSVRSLRQKIHREDRLPRRVEPPFEPPPLFQAYPQAIRHTILEASGSSHGPGAVDGEDEGAEEQPQVEEQSRPGTAHGVFNRFRARRKAKQALTQGANISTPSWSQKIYILVTTGYLLQYSGHGPFDRLPERMLKLTPDSAAFASDAIEGKHWVLQIVHHIKGGHVNQEVSKNFLAKVGVQGSRRIVPSLLLVFGAPEDMDKWMMSIRKEIDAIGGTSPRQIETSEEPEMDVHKEKDMAVQRRYSGIKRQPSWRTDDVFSDGPPMTPTTDASTAVSSHRTSTTLASTPAWSSSRSSKAPPPSLLLPVQESHMQYTDDGTGNVIGPALRSPGFFTQSPMRMDFPHSPSAPSFASTGGGRDYSTPQGVFHPVPDIPARYVNKPLPHTPARRSSLNSISSESDNGSEHDEYVKQDLRQRYSSLGTHPALAPRRHLPIEDSSTDRSSDESNERPLPAHDWPTPPQSSGASQRAPGLTRSSSMEPIGESPPQTPADHMRTVRRPAALKLHSTPTLPSSTYKSRSSVVKVSGQVTPDSVDRAVKRGSVFNKPIPLRISPPQSTRMSVQHSGLGLGITTPPTTSTTTATTSSNTIALTSPTSTSSAAYLTPASTAGPTPLNTAALADIDANERAFPRPAGRLTKSTSTITLSTLSPASLHNPFPGNPHALRNPRYSTQPPYHNNNSSCNSTQVPALRPPINSRASFLRSRASATALGSGERMSRLPPPVGPAPSTPLPATPPPMRGAPALPAGAT